MNIMHGVDIDVLVAYCAMKGVKTATKYTTPDITVKCTRQRPIDLRSSRETFLVSIGKPNYYEKRFIKACLKAGEPFPVKKVQLKFYPKKK